MSRNAVSHFAQMPLLDKPRSVFNLSHKHPTTFNTGQLVPIYIQEILPGDTLQLRTNKIVRMQTPLAPVLDDAYLDTFYFFCPMDILWEHTHEFWGENTKSKWAQSTQYFIPSIKSPAGGWEPGTIADYFGLPVKTDLTAPEVMPSALPFRAYAKIVDEFFRDQNLTDPLNIPLGDATQDGSNGSNYISDVANGGMPFVACKLPDYFSTSLPAPQKGPAVTLPLGSYAPVRTFDDDFPMPSSPSLLRFKEFSGSQAPEGLAFFSNLGSLQVSSTSDSGGKTNVVPVNLGVDLANATGVTIEDLRQHFMLQGYLELDARSGTRYNEFLASHFGVRSSDARLGRPEYLGGNRVRLNMEEVKNTAQATDQYLGDVGGFSKTADSNFDFEKSFTEHGFVIGLACVRYKHTYTQGLERFWTRKDKFDFYDPMFAQLGEQPVMKSEIYVDKGHEKDVWGYQEAWADYRFRPNHASGELRPGIPNALSSWTYADYYQTAPTLSDGWIREDLNNVDRTLAVQSKAANQLFADFWFDVKMARVMPMYSVPALLGNM